MKFFVGGNMNSNFGYNLALAPEIGIQPAKWLRIGAGPRYELQVLTNGNYDRFTTHAVGASVFAEGVIVNRILLHVGYEYLNYPTKHTTPAIRIMLATIFTPVRSVSAITKECLTS